MSLKLNQDIWLLAERLYIHCYSTDSFRVFLKRFDIEYDNDVYSTFNKSAPSYRLPLYKFMSEPNFDFANFMQTIPSFKYLPILQQVVFDPNIIATRRDGWNYYGESIRSWHTKIVEILKTSDVHIDTENKRLVTQDAEQESFGIPDFLPFKFNDLFLDYILKEINESYNNGLYLATITLSRKLFEAMVIRLYEVYFPKKVNGKYKTSNHKLWYDKNKSRYRDLDRLLENLKLKSPDFHEDKDLIEQICKEIVDIKAEANKCVHRDYRIPDEQDVKNLKVEGTMGLFFKIYKKYCNP